MLTRKLREEWNRVRPIRTGRSWKDEKGFKHIDFCLYSPYISSELEMSLKDIWRHQIIISKYSTQYVPVDLKSRRDEKGLYFFITYIESVQR